MGDKEAIMLIDRPRLSITQRCQSPKQQPINPLSLKTYLWSMAMEILVSGHQATDKDIIDWFKECDVLNVLSLGQKSVRH